MRIADIGLVQQTVSRRLVAVFLLAVLATLISGTVQAQQRVALVIGNSAYQHTSVLANPEHDATLIASSLRQRGFEVLLHTNLGFQAMRRAFAAFTSKLEAAGRKGVGLVFYAGHGLQVNGLNYMIPVDARIAKQADVEVEAISATALMRSIALIRNKLNIIILDACRNNPYRSMFRSGGRGLARMDAPIGSMVAFSTAPGTVATDGKGRNSPYSKSLAEAVAIPGLKLEDVFKRVRNDVYRATNGAQVPWESSSIFGDFFFSGGPSSGAAPASPPTGSAAQVWQTIQTSKSPAVLRAFIAQFPKSIFATFAKARLEELARTKTALAKPPAASPAEPLHRQPPPRDNRLRTVMAAGMEPLKSGLRWDIYEAEPNRSGHRKRITYSTAAQPLLDLKDGRYFVTVTRGNASTSGEIQVRAGKPWGKLFVLNAGRLLPTAALAKGQDVIRRGTRWDVYHAAKDEDGKRKHITYATTWRPKFILPVGRYHVLLTYGSAYKSMDLAITAGKTLQQPFILDAGRITLTSSLAKETQPLKRGMRWDVYHAELDEDDKRKHITYSTQWRSRIFLSAGKYYVTARHGNAVVGQEFEIKAGRLSKQHVVLNAGELSLSGGLAPASQPLKSGVRWDVYHAELDENDKRRHITYATNWRPKFVLPASRYYVTMRHGNAAIGQELEISAGKLLKRALSLNAGQVALTSALVGNGKPLRSGLRWDVYHAKADAEGKRTHVTYSTNWRPQFTLSSGRYRLQATHGNATAVKDIVVAPGSVSESQLALNAGRVKLVARRPDGKLYTRPLRWDVYGAKVSFEGKRRHITYTTSRQPTLSLNAGRYLIVLSSGGKRAQGELTVKAGEVRAFDVQLN